MKDPTLLNVARIPPGSFGSHNNVGSQYSSTAIDRVKKWEKKKPPNCMHVTTREKHKRARLSFHVPEPHRPPTYHQHRMGAKQTGR